MRMGNKDMVRMLRPIGTVGFMVIFFVFLGVGVLFFSPAYGGPETMGQSPDAQTGVRAPRDIPLGVEEAIEEDTGQDDADALVLATNEPYLPVRRGEVQSSAPEAAALRQKSGFDAFNAGYQNRWAGNISKETGMVRVLYGAASRPYKNGPEAVAREFLKDTASLFGLKPDLSDLAIQQVDRTPERDHVRLQQTYNGVPVDGVLVLVHATPQGQVTMVQNSYRQGFQPANGQTVALEAAAETAFTDLQAGLGTEAILADSQVEPLIAPYQGSYYYIWRVAISTRNPIGYWVYHIDAESGAILYRADEILSLQSGKGKAYKTNADYLKGKISNVSLKNMFTANEFPGWWGYLYGLHAKIYDYYDWSTHTASQTINSPSYTFLYNLDPNQKAAFDATHAYYQLETVWEWWNTKIIQKYYFKIYNNVFYPFPSNFYSYSIPTIVNVGGLCNAFYTPNIGQIPKPPDNSPYDTNMNGLPGFFFGNENSCAAGSEDWVIDNDWVRHEYTHAIMDWSGFNAQFGGDGNNYGRAMGEGNADFFAFLNTPKDTKIGEVACAKSPDGCLRDLNNTRMYPWDVDYPAWGTPEEHYTGEIWGGYLYDLYRILKSNALPYVYHAFFYFDPAGGLRDGLPDFYDAIWAQVCAESDITGKVTNSIKAWGSMASRGISALLLPPYSHATNYFYTYNGGSDTRWILGYKFPPFKTTKTQGNILHTGNKHEYFVHTTQRGILTATVTAKAGGALNPEIDLYTDAGVFLTSVGPTTPTKVVLTRSDLPADYYIIRVTGDNSGEGRGYYDFTVTFKPNTNPPALAGTWKGTYEILNRYGMGDIDDCIFRETGDITLSITQSGSAFNGNLQTSNVTENYVSGDYCVPPVPPVTYSGWVKGSVTDIMTGNGYRIDVSEASVSGFLFDPSSDGYYDPSSKTLVLKAQDLGTPNGAGWSDNYYLTITVQKQ